MKWYLKKFNELSVRELFEIYYYRMATFVVAQKRIYQGIDKIDLKAYHVYLLNSKGNLIAYARFFPNGKDISFGRVLVLPKYRGKGYGKALITHLLNDIYKVYGNKEITIYSQFDKWGFYHKFGFETVGKPFIYMHTKHIKMAKNIN